MTGAAVSPLEPHLRAAVALHTRPGGYAALVGAGISRSTGVMTAWEVLEELIRRVAAGSGDTDIDDPTGWWMTKTGSEPTYPAVLAEVAATQDERRAILAEFFERTSEEAEDGLKVPSEGHRSLARLMAAGYIRIALTTNFDLLLEEAVRQEGVEPVVVSTVDAIGGMEPLHTQRCVVVHLHGDYLNPGVLNTEDELGSYPRPVETVVNQVFNEYGLLIAGWSAQWDRALAGLLGAASEPRYASWWIQPGALNSDQLALQSARSAEHIDATSDQALGAISDAVEALVDVGQRQDPLIASAAVAAAKRELARPGPAIRTHDRVRAELERVAQCATVRPPDFKGGEDELLRRVEILSASSEVCLALVSALAYWGDEATDRWWFGSIERLAQRQHVGGTTSLIHLTRAPALLVTYAAGVGATAAERWDLVRRLLREPRTESNTGGELLPVALALRPDDLGLPGGAAQINDILWPLITENLGLDGASFVDAWERFEYLHHLVWADAGLRNAPGIYGGGLGWPPHLRIEGLGASENRATADLWFEAAVLAVPDHPLIGDGRLLPRENAENARLAFARALAQWADRADWSLLPRDGGMLPSGRHYPGRYDDNPHPSDGDGL